MANLMTLMRTSYFNVKDPETFKQEIDALKMEDVTVEIGPDRRICVLGKNFSHTYIEDENGETDDEQIYVFDLIREHLIDGEAVLVNGIGWEKMRYILANSTIITPEGIVRVDPEDAVRKLAVEKNLLTVNEANALECTY